MKPFLSALLAAFLVLAWVCPSPAAEPGMPGPDGAALWKYLTQTDPYTKWGQWPDFAGVQKSRSPHGPYVKVHVNRIGLEMAKPPAPYGMIEVKEALDEDGKIRNITVQYKVEQGYNPQGGDWFWVKYSPQGGVDAEGKLEGCIRCHRGSDKNDYITARFFD